MGKNHLLYGKYSSGKRGEVPLNELQQKNQDYVIKHNIVEGIYDNVVDRPLKSGFYDHNPIYEDVFLGNQTTIDTKEWQNALNGNYVKYTLTPYGIQKIIHVNKTGGRLIPKHAKGSPVNTNPLPKHPINTNPVPEVKPKKKKGL